MPVSGPVTSNFNIATIPPDAPVDIIMFEGSTDPAGAPSRFSIKRAMSSRIT